MNCDMMDPETLGLSSLEKLMETDVHKVTLERKDTSRVRVYAHSAKEGSGLSLLDINLNHRQKTLVSFNGWGGKPARSFAVTTPDILGREILLNGSKMALTRDETLPELAAPKMEKAEHHQLTVNPLSYALVQIDQ